MSRFRITQVFCWEFNWGWKTNHKREDIIPWAEVLGWIRRKMWAEHQHCLLCFLTADACGQVPQPSAPTARAAITTMFSLPGCLHQQTVSWITALKPLDLVYEPRERVFIEAIDREGHWRYWSLGLGLFAPVGCWLRSLSYYFSYGPNHVLGMCHGVMPSAYHGALDRRWCWGVCPGAAWVCEMNPGAHQFHTASLKPIHCLDLLVVIIPGLPSRNLGK